MALSALGKEDGFDIVFECSGAELCIQMSVYVSIKNPALRPRFKDRYPRKESDIFFPRLPRPAVRLCSSAWAQET